MALLYSNDFDGGFTYPDFSLPSVDDKNYSEKDFAGSKALLVAFICNHCPYVKAIESRLIDLQKKFKPSQMQLLAICSNDATSYPEDSKTELFKSWREKNYGFPYLVDETQEVAKLFGAVCTPDLFLFDSKRKLYYHGRLDDNWQEESQVKSHDLKNAIDDLLAGKAPPAKQVPSMGCSIKWR